ncbi:hypothetical protein RJT34_27835 [Clitoria ternatea]|uniref:Pectinesterase inhibitor domain-containing protein n=1 Tax=Clitoria ternatea TaxID=43366 RepID=A0AAN9F887_CLITE
MARNLSFAGLMVFVLFVSSSHVAQGVELDSICNKTENYSFCFNLLNSKVGHGTTGVDLVTLAQYAIDVTRVNITNSMKLINHLMRKNANSPEASDHYYLCLKDLGYERGALAHVMAAEEALKVGDYSLLKIEATSIQIFIDACIEGESPEDSPYHDTSRLPKYAHIIGQVTDIIVIISNFLYP